VPGVLVAIRHRAPDRSRLEPSAATALADARSRRAVRAAAPEPCALAHRREAGRLRFRLLARAGDE
jgi:hypothetical protein